MSAALLLLPCLLLAPTTDVPVAGADAVLEPVMPGRPVAAASAAAEDPRQWSVTPYLWATALAGSATIKGNPANVDLSIGDVLDHTDIALQGHVEGQTAEDSVFADIFWASLSAEHGVAPGIEAKLDQELWIAEVGGGLVLGDPPPADGAASRERVEVIGGLRYWRVDADLDVPTVAKASGHKDWVDPFVGLRTVLPMGEHMDLALRGDIGGFGVGSQSSYNLVAAILWDAFENGRLALGYRVLDVDYEDGHGANEFELDSRLKGPFMGLTFRF